MFNLAVILEDSARRFPNEIAISFMQNDLTFQDLNRKVNRLANAFKVFGLQKGDKIALSIPNTPYFPIVYFAALKAGMVVVPLNILLKTATTPAAGRVDRMDIETICKSQQT